eukprot:9509827-Lingulodinium_polyedra.AAC.1
MERSLAHAAKISQKLGFALSAAKPLMLPKKTCEEVEVMSNSEEDIPAAQEAPEDPVVESPQVEPASNSGDTMLQAIEETFLASVSDELNQTKETEVDASISPKVKKYEEDLEAMLKNGDVNVRVGSGWKFAEAHKKGSEAFEKYKTLGSTEKKKAYRLEWARQELANLRKEKVKFKEWADVDITLGEYMPFARVIEMQGYMVDPKGAVQRGTEMCKRLAKMGGKWIFYNDLSKSWEFFFIRRQHQQTFSEKWQLYLKETEEGTAPKAKRSSAAASEEEKPGKIRKK